MLAKGFGVEAVLVVQRALLGIAEYVVGFLYLLEAVLGRLVAGIHVRMAPSRQPPVCLLDRGFFGVARDSEGAVVIFLRHRTSAPPALAPRPGELREDHL